jgi:hypothetical protein
MSLPKEARTEHLRDLSGLPGEDPGIEAAIHEGLGWLCRAHDCSASRDGGVARHFSLVTGWGTSYPETTGYIVPTMLAYGRLTGNSTVRDRGKRMLDWLVSIQLPSGAFQGGSIGDEPVVPVIFNTGQILLGLAAGVREFGEVYRKPMRRAADWLVSVQDPDGCWRKHLSPFVEPGEKAYHVHAAWGLFEVARLEPHKPYTDAAIANVRWAAGLQLDSGWFGKCCLVDESQPLTHALGYALRGILEAYRFCRDPGLLEAACKTGDGLLTAIQEDGFLPGSMCSGWGGAVSWACLTGTAQIAICWFMLYQDTGEAKYREAAYAANQYVRRTMKVDGPPQVRGGIKGSFPVHGGYGTYEYPSWACKFCVDANMLEKAVREEDNYGL